MAMTSLECVFRCALIVLVMAVSETDSLVNVCDSGPCHNGGECVDLTSPSGIKKFECACLEGYEGITCQKRINPCAAEPCENDGQCVPRIGANYHCVCTKNFHGRNCEKKRPSDACEDAPCRPNGECVATNDGFICACRDGYHGPRCASKDLAKDAPGVPVKEVVTVSQAMSPAVIFLLVFAILLIVILLLIGIHCLRVFNRLSSLQAAQDRRVAAGEDSGAVPGWLETSNAMCVDFLCCRVRKTYLEEVKGVIVPVDEYKSLMLNGKVPTRSNTEIRVVELPAKPISRISSAEDRPPPATSTPALTFQPPSSAQGLLSYAASPSTDDFNPDNINGISSSQPKRSISHLYPVNGLDNDNTSYHNTHYPERLRYFSGGGEGSRGSLRRLTSPSSRISITPPNRFDQQGQAMPYTRSNSLVSKYQSLDPNSDSNVNTYRQYAHPSQSKRGGSKLQGHNKLKTRPTISESTSLMKYPIEPKSRTNIGVETAPRSRDDNSYGEKSQRIPSRNSPQYQYEHSFPAIHVPSDTEEVVYDFPQQEYRPSTGRDPHSDGSRSKTPHDRDPPWTSEKFWYDFQKIRERCGLSPSRSPNDTKNNRATAKLTPCDKHIKRRAGYNKHSPRNKFMTVNNVRYLRSGTPVSLGNASNSHRGDSVYARQGDGNGTMSSEDENGNSSVDTECDAYEGEGDEEEEDDDDDEERFGGQGKHGILPFPATRQPGNRRRYSRKEDDGYESPGRLSESDAGGRARDPQSLQARLPGYSQAYDDRTSHYNSEGQREGDDYRNNFAPDAGHDRGVKMNTKRHPKRENVVINHNSNQQKIRMGSRRRDTTDDEDEEEEEAQVRLGRDHDKHTINRERYNIVRQTVRQSKTPTQIKPNPKRTQEDRDNQNSSSTMTTKAGERKKWRRGEIQAKSGIAVQKRLAQRTSSTSSKSRTSQQQSKSRGLGVVVEAKPKLKGILKNKDNRSYSQSGSGSNNNNRNNNRHDTCWLSYGGADRRTKNRTYPYAYHNIG